MKWFYRLGIFIIRGILPVVALFSDSVNHFLKGRKGLFEKLSAFRAKINQPIAWFHVASLGEFEQAKPVIEKLKTARPELKIVVSFFSPSGFDQLSKKPSPLIDFITYLPLDSKRQAEKFVGILKPELVFFVKYDFWYHHIQAIKNSNAALFLISASFRPDQIYFSRIVFFQNLIKAFDLIFTQNLQSIELIESIGYEKGVMVGDTRFDRVLDTASNPKSFPELTQWIGSNQVIVAGSVWQEDMDLLLPQINLNPSMRWIIAPHSLDPEPMRRWISLISSQAILYSTWDKKSSDAQVIFIDNIGMLSSLYQFGYLAYVGGAFGKGLHNILEPIGFKIPVIFGKLRRKEKFPEAEQSIKEGCGFEVSDSKAVKHVIEKLDDPTTYSNSKLAAEKWLRSNQGSSDRIVKEVLKYTES